MVARGAGTDGPADRGRHACGQIDSGWNVRQEWVPLVFTDGKHNYEIDFLLSRGNKLSPLEVKSSGYTTHASLDAFQMKFSSRILQRYLVYTKDLAWNQDVLMLPVFMVGLIWTVPESLLIEGLRNQSGGPLLLFNLCRSCCARIATPLSA